jgi:hypothetical protein
MIEKKLRKKDENKTDLEEEKREKKTNTNYFIFY